MTTININIYADDGSTKVRSPCQGQAQLAGRAGGKEGPNAYAQWVRWFIEPRNIDVTIKNASHSWGKFYQCPDHMDQEIKPEDLDGTVIKAGGSSYVCACGREESPSGTTGQFDLYDGDTYIGTASWDCPWGKQDNTWQFAIPDGSNYMGTVRGGSPVGAIGELTLLVAKIASASGKVR